MTNPNNSMMPQAAPTQTGAASPVDSFDQMASLGASAPAGPADSFDQMAATQPHPSGFIGQNNTRFDTSPGAGIGAGVEVMRQSNTVAPGTAAPWLAAAQGDIAHREAGVSLVKTDNGDGTFSYTPTQTAAPSPLSDSSKAAIMWAYQQHLDPLGTTQHYTEPGMLQAAQQADAHRRELAALGGFENFRHGTAAGLAHFGSSIVGVASPSTAAEMNRNIDAAYLTNPDSTAAIAGRVTGGMIPMIPGVLANPAAAPWMATIAPATTAAMTLNAIGGAREDAYNTRQAGGQVSGGEEIANAAIQAAAMFYASKMRLGRINENPVALRDGVFKALKAYSVHGGLGVQDMVLMTAANNASRSMFIEHHAPDAADLGHGMGEAMTMGAANAGLSALGGNAGAAAQNARAARMAENQALAKSLEGKTPQQQIDTLAPLPPEPTAPPAPPPATPPIEPKPLPPEPGQDPGLFTPPPAGEPAPKAPAPAPAPTPEPAPAPTPAPTPAPEPKPLPPEPAKPEPTAPPAIEEPKPAAAGKDTKIATQTGEVPARYEAVESDTLRPSHDPMTFQPNPEHVGGQERQYHTDKNEQLKVVQASGEKFDPRFVTSDAPTPADGPPAVLDDGSVIGGNSRSMIVKRVYADPQRADALKAHMVGEAAKLGIDPKAVEGMSKPVIIRRLTGETRQGMTPDRAAELSRKLQKGLTQEMGADADHASRAKILLKNPESLAIIERMFQGDRTVRDALADNKLAKALVEHLQKAGVVTSQEVSQFFTADGKFTKQGKDLVEGVLLRTVVDDPNLLEDVPHQVTTKLTGNLADLAYTKARAGFDLGGKIKLALEAYHRFRAAGYGADAQAIKDWYEQGQLTPDPIHSNPDAKRLFELFVTDSAKDFKARLRHYAADARANDPAQNVMFGGGVKPEKAFADAFHAEKAPNVGGIEASSASAVLGDKKDAPAERTYTAQDMLDYIKVKSADVDEAGARALLGDKTYVKRDVPIESLTTRGNVEAKRDAINEYAKKGRRTAPPVVADEAGKIIDGNRRLEAAKLRGDKTISAYVPLEDNAVLHDGQGDGPALRPELQGAIDRLLQRDPRAEGSRYLAILRDRAAGITNDFQARKLAKEIDAAFPGTTRRPPKTPDPLESHMDTDETFPRKDESFDSYTARMEAMHAKKLDYVRSQMKENIGGQVPTSFGHALISKNTTADRGKYPWRVTTFLSDGRPSGHTTHEFYDMPNGERDYGPYHKSAVGEAASMLKVPDQQPSSMAATPLPQPKPANAVPATPGSPGPLPVTALHGVKMPELVRLATEVLGKIPLVRWLPDSWGLINTRDGQIKINKHLPVDPLHLVRTMAHELGHGFDWLPDKLVGIPRGDMLARVMTLTPLNAALSTMRRSLHDLAGRTPNDVLEKEATKVSAWWRPGDMTTPYRKSPVERFADVLSVFLNDPGALEREAPNLYREWLNYMGEKPEVLKSYVAVQQILNGIPEDLAKSRADYLTEGYGRGEEAVRQALRDGQEARQSPYDFLMQLFTAGHTDWLKKRGEAVKAGKSIPAPIDPKYFFEEYTASDSKLRLFLEGIKNDVSAPLLEVGLDHNVLGQYLQHTRAAEGDRAQLANPGGFQASDAKFQLDMMRKMTTPAQWSALEKSAQALRDHFFARVEEAHASGIYSDEAFDAAKENKDKYATFAMVEHIGDHLPAKMFRQVGTFKETANPFANMLMKAQSMIRATAMNDAKRSGVSFLHSFFPDEVTSMRSKFGPGGMPVDPPAPPRGREYLTVMTGGKPRHFLVDEYFAKAYQSHDIGMMRRLAGMMSGPTYKVFHPLYVTFNAAWQSMNYLKDFQRTYINAASAHGVSLVKMLGAYWESIPPAMRRARGMTDPLLSEMLKNKALDVAYAQHDLSLDDTTVYNRMIDRMGLGETKDHGKLLNFVTAVPRFIEAAAVLSESLPKIAAYNALKGKAITEQERAHFVRNFAGTPNIHRRGLGSALSNALFMYSNVAVQGMIADAQIATDPKTRAGFWMRTALINLLPRVAMTAALHGAYGDDYKEMMANVGTYDRQHYLCIPFGWQVGEDGKRRARVLRIPYDKGQELIGSMFQAVLDGHWKDDKAGALQGLYTAAASHVPNLSPPITIASKWLEYAAGGNPNDNFRGRPILDRNEAAVRGTAGLKKMATWTRDQTGFAGDMLRVAFNTRQFNGDGGLRPFFKTTDQGIREQQDAAIAHEDADAAELRMALPDSVQRLSAERYRLDRLGKDAPDQARRARLNGFYQNSYLPMVKRIKAMEQAGNHTDAAALRKHLGDLADKL